MHAHTFTPSADHCQKEKKKKRVFFHYTGSAHTNHFSVTYVFYGHEDEKRPKLCPKLNKLIPIFTPLPK